MTGTLAQIIALTAFGNDFLKNGTIPADFNSANTTFQFCFLLGFCRSKMTHNVSRLQEVAMNQDQALTNIEKTFN